MPQFQYVPPEQLSQEHDIEKRGSDIRAKSRKSEKTGRV